MQVKLMMSEFCDSAHTEFCAELAVVCRINKAAQKLWNFADFVQQYCSQFGIDGCNSQRKAFQCKSDKIFCCSVHLMLLLHWSQFKL